MAPAWLVLFEASHNPLYVSDGPLSTSYRPPKSLPGIIVAVPMRSLLLGCTCRLGLGISARAAYTLSFCGSREFVHLGLLHTADNFARIKRCVFEEPREPWVSAFVISPVADSPKLLIRWLLSAQELERADVGTDDEAHARKGIEVLTRWASIFFVVNRSDLQLVAGLQVGPMGLFGFYARYIVPGYTASGYPSDDTSSSRAKTPCWKSNREDVTGCWSRIQSTSTITATDFDFVQLESSIRLNISHCCGPCAPPHGGDNDSPTLQVPVIVASNLKLATPKKPCWTMLSDESILHRVVPLATKEYHLGRLCLMIVYEVD
ncbi:uncharacterized protein ARMOST_21844 [Armillaria ostoyae]|uniref:Uncharacterized protein n=1 Tax=Armillaria ostoyae TaxID=47428 RepID=A0A284SBC1_ARMOS|nr:uncharacterized protein ARMOST_21844 [Armillaria ostoyae]